MKKLSVGLVVVLSLTMLLPIGTRAQDEDAQEGVVAQGELAQLLVNVLGLNRYLPASPSAQACIAVLMSNGIVPADGWEPDKVVVKADLARIVVLSMGRGSEVEDPDDPLSWIAFLEGLGVSIDTIGTAVDALETFVEPVTPHVFQTSATVDPLIRRRTAEPDEREYGADAEYTVSILPVGWTGIRRVLKEVAVIRPPRKPVTPD